MEESVAVLVPFPVPFSAMFWLAEGVVLSALSVNVALPVRGPLLCGSKLMLRLQVAPGANAKEVGQSAGEPEPGT